MGKPIVHSLSVAAAEGGLSTELQKLMLKQEVSVRRAVARAGRLDVQVALDHLKVETDSVTMKYLLESGTPWFEKITPETLTALRNYSKGVIKKVARHPNAPQEWVLTHLKEGKLPSAALLSLDASYWDERQKVLVHLLEEGVSPSDFACVTPVTSALAQKTLVRQIVRGRADGISCLLQNDPAEGAELLESLRGFEDSEYHEILKDWVELPPWGAEDWVGRVLDVARYSKSSARLAFIAEGCLQNTSVNVSVLVDTLMRNDFLDDTLYEKLFELQWNKPHFRESHPKRVELIKKALRRELRRGPSVAAARFFINGVLQQLKSADGEVFDYILENAGEYWPLRYVTLSEPNCPLSAALKAPAKESLLHFHDQKQLMEHALKEVGPKGFEVLEILAGEFSGSLGELLEVAANVSS